MNVSKAIFDNDEAHEVRRTLVILMIVFKGAQDAPAQGGGAGDRTSRVWRHL